MISHLVWEINLIYYVLHGATPFSLQCRTRTNTEFDVKAFTQHRLFTKQLFKVILKNNYCIDLKCNINLKQVQVEILMFRVLNQGEKHGIIAKLL